MVVIAELGRLLSIFGIVCRADGRVDVLVQAAFRFVVMSQAARFKRKRIQKYRAMPRKQVSMENFSRKRNRFLWRWNLKKKPAIKNRPTWNYGTGVQHSSDDKIPIYLSIMSFIAITLRHQIKSWSDCLNNRFISESIEFVFKDPWPAIEMINMKWNMK